MWLSKTNLSIATNCKQQAYHAVIASVMCLIFTNMHLEHGGMGTKTLL